MRLEPQTVVYVGDSDEDIRGARAAGIRPILIRRRSLDETDIVTDYRAGPPVDPRGGASREQAEIEVIAELSELLRLLS